MKLLHAADLHIDSPMRGLVRYERAPVEQMRGATRAAVENLVDLALKEQVTAVLLAGDVYDGTWRDVNTGLFFTGQMARLQEADIPVFMISGNHDAENKMTMELPLPGNVHRFDSGSPGTKVREDLGLAVHGESFARGAVPHNLAEGYPSARSGLFNVGLLHTSLNGRPGHDRYAPCTVEQLANHGYQYWALGHVHHRAVEHSDGPYVVFPGNTQGRDAGETGPKGCTLVTVEDLQVLGSPEHHDLDSSARWHEVRVDMADVEDLADACVQVEEQLTSQVVDRAQPGQANAVRVVAFGPSEAHTALVRGREDFTNAVRRIGQEHPSVWIEKVRVETDHPREWVDPEQVADIVAGVRQEGERLLADPEQVRGIVDATRIRTKLHTDLRGLFTEDGWTGRMSGEAVELLTALLEEKR
ncbi:exonuclease SbcCD subunit D [Nocardiopsis sp. NPDC006938]|uniref:metallophosphoesterase family protein n=1 Tax=Nocardiopsis sp. NPDC006938 TaxID=3364337 RepID=UPI003698316D